jgi:hypothetical protein
MMHLFALDATDYFFFYTRYRNTTMESVIESSASQNAFPIPGHQLCKFKRKLTVNPSSSLTCRATRASTPTGSFCLLSLSTRTGLGFGVGVQASFPTLPSCDGNLGLTEDALFLALCWTHLTNSAIALLSDIGRDRTFDRGVVIGIAIEALVRAGVTGGTCRGNGRMGRSLVVGEEGWLKAWGGGIQVHPHHLSGADC